MGVRRGLSQDQSLFIVWARCKIMTVLDLGADFRYVWRTDFCFLTRHYVITSMLLEQLIWYMYLSPTIASHDAKVYTSMPRVFVKVPSKHTRTISIRYMFIAEIDIRRAYVRFHTRSLARALHIYLIDSHTRQLNGTILFTYYSLSSGQV